jgi:hypothetical protein
MSAYWLSDRWKEAWGLTIVIALLTALDSKVTVWFAEASGALVNAIALFHHHDNPTTLPTLLSTAGLLVALVRIADLRWGGPSAYGQATAAFGFGALAAPALFWLGRSPIRQVHLGMALFAAVLSALVPVPVTGLALVFALLGAAGAAAVHVEAAATELLQAHVPDRIRAHLLGVTDALMVGAAMVGSFGGPVLVGWAGGAASLAVLALVTLVAGALALPIVGRRVGLPEPGH